jgi:hypothetical protein
MKYMDKNFRMLIPLIAAALFYISGCSTPAKPAAAEPPKKAPPDWVLAQPPANAQYEFFVGSSSDASGDPAKAEEQAVYALIAEITRYMGVRITSETTSEAKASLDAFQAQVTQQVKQEGSARVTGFRVADKFVDREKTRVTVYILAQYERAELEKEKARLAAVFQEQIDAVAVPEQRGKEFETRGDLFNSIKSYIEAAVAASGSNIDNAAIKFERNINNAKRVVGRIGLVPLSGGISGAVGEPLPDTFRLKIVNGQNEKDPPVPGADIQVSYKEVRSGGRAGIRTASLQSDRNGMVEFEHPTPTFVGSEKLTMMLDLSAFIRPLDRVPRNFSPYVSGLQDLVNTKRADFEYTVLSRAKDVPTGIVILDMDGAGNPTGGSGTAAGILEALSADGFKVRTLAYNSAMLKGMSDADIVKSIAASFGTQVERIIFGSIAIDEFEEAKGTFQVRVAGTVKAADLKSGQVFYSKRMFKRSIGSGSDGAISAAFRNLGVDFGKDLSRNLP